MSQAWPTKEKDIQTARSIMENYANERQSDSLGLFEVMVNIGEKTMNFCLSGWVTLIAKHFVSTYGASQGDYITRQIISHCITQNHTIH